MFLKTKTFIIAAFFVASSLTLFNSCKKDSEEDSSSCPIKEIREEYISPEGPRSYIIGITYSGGKIVKAEGLENSLTSGVITYAYEANKITVTYNDPDGETRVHVYNLDNKNRIVSAKRTFPQDYDLEGSYTYNSENQLKTASTTLGSDVFNFNLEYSNGNLVYATRAAYDSSPEQTETFEYNSLEPYQDVLSCGNPLNTNGNILDDLGDPVLISAGYFGAHPKNLLVSDTRNSYEYTKDKNGSITKITSPKWSSTTEFIRKCN